MNNEILENLNKNLIDINNIEDEMSRVQIAIYQKSIEKIKKEKMNELNSYLKLQSDIYNQNIKEYSKVDEIINEYNDSINKIISIYDNLYLFILEYLSKARNNQKIAVANLVTLSKRKNRESISKEDKEYVETSIMACAQKKVNYMVIVDECVARLKWCINESVKDISEMFSNNTSLIISDENIFTKLKRWIFNKISGKKKFSDFLDSYISNELKTLNSKLEEKSVNLITIIKGIELQLTDVEKQIENSYKKAFIN